MGNGWMMSQSVDGEKHKLFLRVVISSILAQIKPQCG